MLLNFLNRSSPDWTSQIADHVFLSGFEIKHTGLLNLRGFLISDLEQVAQITEVRDTAQGSRSQSMGSNGSENCLSPSLGPHKESGTMLGHGATAQKRSLTELSTCLQGCAYSTCIVVNGKSETGSTGTETSGVGRDHPQPASNTVIA
ncbi:hypothetical protein H920_06017 [Fukomys damarensis]|uniref:Uncharacterized protein n=1 Tax=Fukomys damarensis TaxID=885580 RepID=A0A091EBF9_FUKDA|nr:hypothetical protein H920_06017 [Fukomys damarensis]